MPGGDDVTVSPVNIFCVDPGPTTVTVDEGMDKNQLVVKASTGARFHHKLVFIHPFVNGNGRWARIYTEYVYWRNGYIVPSWHPEMDPYYRRQIYIAALREADMKNFEPLIDFVNS